MEVKRELPFFAVTPSYYTRKFFGLFWEQTPETPFGYKPQNFAKRDNSPGVSITFKRRKNILLIVTDSLRAKDIKQDPTLTPNLNHFFENGFTSYDHLATANCTHFSFYSMLSGKLATSFGNARRSGGSNSLIKTFANNGYKTSSSEATSLDWYDVSSIIFAEDTNRVTWDEDTDDLRNDTQVTKNTIKTLKEYAKDNTPFFHLSYYYGNHFPYLSETDTTDLTLKERYLASIRTFDTQIGEILSYINTSGLADDTVVIVTSDHGEELREGGIMGHSGRLSDEQVYVPFWLSGLPQNYFQNIKSHIDLHSTISTFMEGRDARVNNSPIILTNCDYDFPSAFAVLRKDSRNDFLYDHGYLSPMQKRNTEITKKQQIEDANLLLGIIKGSEN
ncbi:sulfatase-like hydrolase/transferase [Kordiimonas sp. SCSIO 12603]|uniref:sulfatase-like hydrolase/transferase n=1 Tax=Kordiimonas sp. SCSIO 12603 TaxID=2829596 RepID=UPI0021037A01|nr:sulfatase-like hydrolase/transferase [Kordiimonas sp. SCSIO 12603]UTW58221.1 sulfatase-like hydrolase/transferase [Kordiimonas sp. SCSIO 12603]